jgi:hypothetical protein
MSNPSTTESSTEFFHRRLAEPFPTSVFGNDSGRLWLGVLVPILVVAFIYVVIMYVRDARRIGVLWAGLLGLLRTTIYLVLAYVFLLPAQRTVEHSQTRSRVVVLFDVSQSMDTRDDPPGPGKPFEKLKTRQDKILDFLFDGDKDFFGRLKRKNPVSMYRFASRADEKSLTLEDRDLVAAPEEGARDPQHVCDARLMQPYLTHWLKPMNLKPFDDRDLPQDVRDHMEELQAGGQGKEKELREFQEKVQEVKDRIAELQERNKTLQGAEMAFFNRTALGDSALMVLQQEVKSNLVQGIVIFTDGRDNSGASKAFRDLKTEAERAKVPIFVVGIGDVRPRVRIDVKSLQLPPDLQPDDRFQAEIQVEGEGLPGQPVTVELEVTHVRIAPGKDDEQLDIQLMEDLAPEKPKEGEQPKPKEGEQPKPREAALLSLGKSIKFQAKANFDTKKTPPTATISIPLEAAEFAKAAGVNLDEGENAKKKWVLAPTPDGYLRFRVSVPRAALEVWPEPFHYSDKIDVKVLKQKLRVLLFAGGPSRDFQYVRNLIQREAEKDQMELSVYLQQYKGEEDKRRMAMWQDTLKDRFLIRFPVMLEGKVRLPRGADDPGADYSPGPEEIDRFRYFYDDPKDASRRVSPFIPSKRDERPWGLYDLDNYDVIIVFDPDWSELDERSFVLLRQWVDAGGGLVFVGGGLNTMELGRPDANKNKFKPLIDLLPVELADVRKYITEIKSDKAWPLDLTEATPDLEFLRLEDEGKFLDDWERFFNRDKNDPLLVERGFHTVYPIKDVKAGSRAVARYTDPGVPEMEGSKRGKQPFLVVADPPRGGRRVWLGAGETWRLRTGPNGESHFERFWTKLTRYAGAHSQREAKKKVRVTYDKRGKVNERTRVTAEVISKGGQRLPQGVKPRIKVDPLDGPDAEKKRFENEVEMQEAEGKPGKFTYEIDPRVKGRYAFEVKVPTEGLSSEQKLLFVEPDDPEMNDLRPDFKQMYDMASEITLVEGRMGDRAADLRRRLERPRMETPDGKVVTPSSEEALRLYFELKNADLIPDCMVQDVVDKKVQSKPDDLWDWSFTLYTPKQGKPVKVPAVMLGVILLFSVEWLIRKLLRLA